MPAEFYRERLPALCAGDKLPELALIHGWAASSAIWRPLLPQLRQWGNVTLIDLPGHGASPPREGEDVDDLLQRLLTVMPERAVYIGWSLGGMLATRLAAQAPQRVQALITVATNAVFIARDDWPAAMPCAEWRRFSEDFAGDADMTLRRFQVLQCRGDRREKTLLRELRHQPAARSEGLATGLDWLRNLDNRQALTALQCPVLHIFGERDALVPAAVREDFNAAWPQQQTVCLQGCAHLPFLSQPDQFLECIDSFLQNGGLRAQPAVASIDKRAVAQSFSRAADSYDSVAHLQRRVADHLLGRVPADCETVAVVDIGCGTGYSLPALRESVPAARLYALDLAEGMLRYAARHRDADGWLCGDAENLPLADESASLLFSSLSVQWCENLDAVFAEAYRVLRSGGQLLLATLGPQTLDELRCAWRAVDDYTHVNRFADREQVAAAIAGSGLELLDWEEQLPCLYYGQLRDLMAELKQLGAHNINPGRPGGLTSRRRLRHLLEAYEAFRGDSGLPATYQVWYLTLRKTDA